VGEPVTALDLRLRAFLLLLRVTRATSVGDGSPKQIARLRSYRAPRSTLMDRLLGSMAPDVEVSDRRIPSRGGPLPVRLYRPRLGHDASRLGQRLPVVLAFHGGGWTIGTLEQGDRMCSQIASRTGSLVVAVDYRLAPENGYPAAREDARHALVWVTDAADELGVDPSRLAVLGDSAGGNLAAVTCLQARDEGGPPIRFQVLLYPAVDLLVEETQDVRRETPLLRAADAEVFRRFYLGPHGDPRDPYVSPLRASTLAGLPPALVVTAEYDLLRESGRQYAQRLAADGVPVRHTDYVGMPHGFVSLPGVCRSAPQALAEVCAALTGALQPGALNRDRAAG
jgi:acetyl esterase